MTVIRPAESHEVAGAWAAALQAEGPVALLLTRQDLPAFDEEMAKKVDVSKGAYVVSDDEDFALILIATGSEVGLALKTAEMFRAQEIGVRVVSMPSQALIYPEALNALPSATALL